MILSVHHSKSAILLAIYYILVKHKNTYCWPTRQTLLDRLKEYRKIVITLSCLDQHLGDIRDQGLIKSFRRWGRKPDGTVYNKTSNRSLTLKGLNYLRSQGVKIEKYLWEWIFKGIRPKNPRGPKYDPDAESLQQRSGDPESIGSILNHAVNPEIV